MAGREAKVRVRLDTKQSEADLRDLGKKAKAAAGRVGKNLRSAVGRGMGIVGLGAGVGAGIQAVRGATQSGIGDVVGEALGGFGHQISEFFLGSLNEDAKASRSAREETMSAFASVAGAQGKIPEGALNYFNQIKALRMQEEKGRELFEGDDRFRGPGIGDVIDRVLDGIGKLLLEAVGKLADMLNPFN